MTLESEASAGSFAGARVDARPRARGNSPAACGTFAPGTGGIRSASGEMTLESEASADVSAGARVDAPSRTESCV